MYSLAKLSEQSNKRTPEKHLFSGVLAHLTGFEPVAYRLGVAPISHREVTPDAKKCLEILGFSAFQILSDTTL